MGKAHDHEVAQSVEQVDLWVHHDRVFLNNPLVMHGMGLAPLVVVATSVDNAIMLMVAVALLLTPTRMLASLLLRNVTSHILRGIGYMTLAGMVYFGVYSAMETIFTTQILNLGIYLPLLVVEPLVIYRMVRVPEPLHKAARKGVLITFGYAIVLILVGAAREFLALGTIHGWVLTERPVFPIAATPAGGFLMISVLCAIWRTLAQRRHTAMILQAKQER